MIKWQKLSQSEVKVGYKTITTKHFRLPNGTQTEFTTTGRIGAQVVATIALTSQNKVVVARQYRPGPERIMDEIPGGGVEHGETIEHAAARELLEETGYASDKPFVAIGSSCRDAYTNETSNYFIAVDCRKIADQKLDSTEFIDVVLLDIDQVVQNAKTGLTSDAVAVLMAYEQLMELQHG